MTLEDTYYLLGEIIFAANFFKQEIFDLKFKRGGKQHPYLYSMKTCGLKNMDVNYSDSSSQSYASYYDGSPVSLTLKLDFTELSPVYNEDYDEKFSDELLEEGPGF